MCKLCGHFRWSLRDLTGTKIQMYASVSDRIAPESVLMCFSLQNGSRVGINMFFLYTITPLLPPGSMGCKFTLKHSLTTSLYHVCSRSSQISVVTCMIYCSASLLSVSPACIIIQPLHIYVPFPEWSTSIASNL